MRILRIDTYYPRFLAETYRRAPLHLGQAYREQLSWLLSRCFGTSDFLSVALRAMNVDVTDVIANCGALQLRWALENMQKLSAPPRVRAQQILSEQIRALRPDVVFVEDPNWVKPDVLRRAREAGALVVGQIASPLLPTLDTSVFDLFFTSLPHLATLLRRLGTPAEVVPLAFDASVNTRMRRSDPAVDVGFVGQLGGHHAAALETFEAVAIGHEVSVWTPTPARQLSRYPSLKRAIRGQRWGLQMFEALASSRISLNRHASFSLGSANNLRLFEATGVGSLLLTDQKSNLKELFRLDSEVVAYKSPAECVERVRWLLEHDQERRSIAAAGQRRTLTDHTYANRAAQMLPIMERALSAARPPRPARFALSAPRRKQLLDRVLTRARGAVLRASRAAPPLRETAHADELRRAERSSWASAGLAAAHASLIEQELFALHCGDVRSVFRAAAQALGGVLQPGASLLDVGAASGAYAEALPALLGFDMRYVGGDVSVPALRHGRQHDRSRRLVALDACALPFADASVDVAMASGVLLHVADWETALRELVRVARTACVFHRLLVGPSERIERKRAYDEWIVERVLTAPRLREAYRVAGVTVTAEIDTGEAAAGEYRMLTHVCVKGPSAAR